MMIEIEGRSEERVIRALGGLPEVTTIHTTNGRWDVVVELGTDMPAGSMRRCGGSG